MIRSSIDRDKGWNFMKVQEIAAPMNEAAQQLEDYIAQEEFVSAAVLTSEDLSKLRTQFPGGRFEMGLEQLAQNLEAKVKALEIQLNSVIDQHKVVMRAATLAAEAVS